MSIINEQEQQQHQITNVIRLGKEQNYLTHAQLNDLLPNLVDTEHFDVIVHILENMNIKVFEQAPGEDELIALFGSTEEVPEDTEEAATILASVDKETGRVTDPVRAYMREMGTVELLTREGEIRIAKRIEEGIYQVLHSLAHSLPFFLCYIYTRTLSVSNISLPLFTLYHTLCLSVSL